MTARVELDNKYDISVNLAQFTDMPLLWLEFMTGAWNGRALISVMVFSF